MLISIERKAVSHLQRPVQLNCLFLALTAMAMPFHASMAADAASSHGVTSVLRSEVTTESAKTEVSPQVSPQQAKCLLAVADALHGTKLLPGISKGTVDPGAVSAVDTSAQIRIWSAPDPQEVDVVMLHYVEISSPRYQVFGIHSGSPPYGIEMLVLRDSAVALPCGLRVGQMIEQFIKTLGQPTGKWPGGNGTYFVEYSLERGWRVITLLLGSEQAVQEIRWEYGVH